MKNMRSAILILTDPPMFFMYNDLQSSSPLNSCPPTRAYRRPNKVSDINLPVNDQICAEIHCQSNLGNEATFNVFSLFNGIKHLFCFDQVEYFVIEHVCLSEVVSNSDSPNVIVANVTIECLEFVRRFLVHSTVERRADLSHHHWTT